MVAWMYKCLHCKTDIGYSAQELKIFLPKIKNDQVILVCAWCGKKNTIKNFVLYNKITLFQKWRELSEKV
jgi:transcription elongation factor Elf1